MTFERYVRAAALTLAIVLGGELPGNAAEPNDGASAPLFEQAAHRVREFQATKAPARLRQAVSDLEAVDAPRKRGPERDRATRAWFALFRALDGAKDPSFDPKDVPYLNVVPPSSNGVVYPSGVDPAAIAEPVARAAYETALRANREKSERFVASYALADVDTRATDAFRRYRLRTFAPTGEDASDFARLLSDSHLVASRKRSLLR